MLLQEACYYEPAQNPVAAVLSNEEMTNFIQYGLGSCY